MSVATSLERHVKRYDTSLLRQHLIDKVGLSDPPGGHFDGHPRSGSCQWGIARECQS
jgi:hypothetical protein